MHRFIKPQSPHRIDRALPGALGTQAAYLSVFIGVYRRPKAGLSNNLGVRVLR
jgi:hypothetical protein